MATRRKIGGHVYREKLNIAMRANVAMLRKVEILLETQPNRTLAILAAGMAVELGKSQEALQELDRITRGATGK